MNLTETQAAGSRQGLVLTAIESFVSSCLDVQCQPARALRLLVPNTPIQDLLKLHARKFENQTGIPVVLTPVNFYEMGQEVQSEVTNELEGFSDGWVMDPSATGELASMGAFKDLNAYIPQDPSIAWYDISRFFRDVSAIFERKVIGIPLDGDLFLMYYRRDLFERYNLSVPVTWDDFVSLAFAMNGTDTDGDGKPDLQSVCFDTAPPVCKANFLLVAMMAPYLQYQGTQQGVFFDPPTLKPLTNNPAMRKAMQHYLDLWQLQKDLTPTCLSSNPLFSGGKCLMTINFGDEFKANALIKGNHTDGQLGVAQLPGAAVVLDRATNQLVPCNAQLCPYARNVTLANGTNAFVNYAPYSAFGGWIGTVNNKTTPDFQLAAYQFFASFVAPESSWDVVLDPASGIDPYRRSHLETNGPNFDRWVKAGYDSSAAHTYLDAVNMALESPNMVLDGRLQYVGVPYRLAFEFGLHNLTYYRIPDATVDSVMAEIELQMNAGVAAVGNESYLQDQYCSLLGCESLLRSQQATAGGARTRTDTKVTVLVAVLVPCGVLLLAALAALAVWRHQTYRSVLHGGVRAPGAGPNTTLLITDIESSSALWEMLPEEAMDAAIQLHHTIVRRALAKHHGYESATEGDSFICAFHTAEDATQCAMHIQQELINAPWPQPLLSCTESPAVAEVTMGAGPGMAAMQTLLAVRETTNTADGPLSRYDHSLNTGALSGGLSPRDDGGSGALSQGLARAPSLPPPPPPVQTRPAADTRVLKAAAERLAGPAALPQAVVALRATSGTAVAAARLSAAGLSTMEIEDSGSRYRSAMGSRSVSQAFEQLSGAHAVAAEAPAEVAGTPAGASPMHAVLQLTHDSVPQGSPGALVSTAGTVDAYLPTMPRVEHSRLANATGGVKTARSYDVRGGASSPSMDRSSHEPATDEVPLKGHSGTFPDLPAMLTAGLATVDTASGARPQVAQVRLRDYVTSAWIASPAYTTSSIQGLLSPIFGSDARAPNNSSRRLMPGGLTLFRRESQMNTTSTPQLIMHQVSFIQEQPAGEQRATGDTASAPLPARASATLHTAHSSGVTGFNGAQQRQSTKQLKQQPSMGAPVTGAVVFRGLRVRMGLHSGVTDPADVSYNKLESRYHYAGLPMRLSRAIQGAAAGGQVLLSGATFALVREARSASEDGVDRARSSPGTLSRSASGAGPAAAIARSSLPGTRTRFGGGRPAAAGRGGEAPLLLHMGLHDLGDPDLQPQQVYQAVSQALLGRLALFPPLKVRRSLALGVLEAPVGPVCVVFMHVVGADGLLSWDAGVARQALGLLEDAFTKEAWAGKGYVVEATGGVILATFNDPADALAVCLRVVEAMPEQPWPAALLENPLCEELAVTNLDGHGRLARQVLFRGLRVKAGMDYGNSRASINGRTGRFAYRGRVMNRAARVVGAASAGQVLCSRDAWLAAAPSLDAAASVDNGQPLVSGISMGPRVLKGIADPVELFMVTLQDRARPVTVNGIIMEDMDGSVGEALGYESGGRVTGVQGGVRQSPQGGNSGKIRRASLVLNVGGSASASVGAGPSSREAGL